MHSFIYPLNNSGKVQELWLHHKSERENIFFFFTKLSGLSLDAALEEGNHLNELSLRPEHDRTFSIMSKKPVYAPMMETIKPYREKLIQAKRQLDEAWKGEMTSQLVVTSSQPDDVHELRENLSRVRIEINVW